jgi:hypothetical protein
MTRRHALVTLAGTGAGAGLVLALVRLRRPGLSVEGAFNLKGRSEWRELGKGYLAHYPTDRDTAGWVAGMLSGFKERGDDPQALRRAVSHQVARDFELGRIVDIEGWTLSRTEARLAALAVLAEQR